MSMNSILDARIEMLIILHHTILPVVVVVDTTYRIPTSQLRQSVRTCMCLIPDLMRCRCSSVAATQLMTPERRRAIWAIYGKQASRPSPACPCFLYRLAIGAKVPFVFSEW